MTTTINLQDLQEKIKTALAFTEPNSETRRATLNAIRFLVGNEMYKQAMENIANEQVEEHISKAHTTTVDVSCFIGKKLHNHDSWNGSSMTITIESFEIEGESIRFIGTNAWGGKSGIYIGGNQLVDLLKTGHAEVKRELEGCTCKETWDLKDA